VFVVVVFVCLPMLVRTSTNPTFCCIKQGMVFLVKYLLFEAYPLLAPKCRVGAGEDACVEQKRVE
jgi:hypothetical protein